MRNAKKYFATSKMEANFILGNSLTLTLFRFLRFTFHLIEPKNRFWLFNSLPPPAWHKYLLGAAGGGGFE